MLFPGIHGYRHEQLTTGHSSHFSRAGSAVRDLPCGAARAPGKTPGRGPEQARPGPPGRRLPGDRSSNRPRGNAPGTSPAVGQRRGHLIWVEDDGGSSPSSWTRRPRNACYRPSGRQQRALRRKSAPHPAQGTRRPWLNRTERLPTKQEGAGSSPAGRAVSEAEVGDAPGCGPGGSGFEPRRTPSVIPGGADVAVPTRTQYPRGSGPTGRGAWLRTRRFRVRIPGAARTDTEITDPSARCRAHWRGGGTT